MQNRCKPFCDFSATKDCFTGVAPTFLMLLSSRLFEIKFVTVMIRRLTLKACRLTASLFLKTITPNTIAIKQMNGRTIHVALNPFSGSGIKQIENIQVYRVLFDHVYKILISGA